MSVSERTWTSWLSLPGEFLLAVVGLKVLLDPALWLATELLGYPYALQYAQVASLGFAVVIAPLYVGELLSLSRLWDHALVLLAALASTSLLAVAAGVLLGSGGGPGGPVALAPLVALAYLATFVVTYVHGVRL